jgi:hypothetical protein
MDDQASPTQIARVIPVPVDDNDYVSPTQVAKVIPPPMTANDDDDGKLYRIEWYEINFLMVLKLCLLPKEWLQLFLNRMLQMWRHSQILLPYIKVTLVFVFVCVCLCLFVFVYVCLCLL